jgi:Dolichyl-phosphate-mannose-protein mannosyltransferase
LASASYNPGRRSTSDVAVCLAIFAGILLLHAPLLRLPYYWDEAGYYIPSARELLLTGSLIPKSPPSNAHPPLIMAFLALCWKIAGFSITVTRTAMLLVASFALLGVFRLARAVANAEVAIAATLCTALYPVFFAQSSMALIDVGAAGFAFWGLHSYLSGRQHSAALWFTLAVLTKETAVLVPAALLSWEVVSPLASRWSGCELSFRKLDWNSGWLLLPLGVLCIWYAFHYWRTGYVFGNPEFFRYNVRATVSPLRILLAFITRLWQTFGYLHLWVLTLLMACAMASRPLRDGDRERPRIAIPIQLVFGAVILTFATALAIVGGAVLARYMLTAVPLMIIVAVSTLWRRIRAWRWLIAAVCVAFVTGLFLNPPYGFSPEDNLAYSDFIRMHVDAERFLEQRYRSARVLTAWPASDEITQPYLGYVSRPLRVVRIEDFTVEEVMSAAELRSQFDVALVFSTKYEPPHPLLERWPAWERTKTRLFGYHRDLPPAAAAQLLDGRIVFTEARHGLWIAVIEIERIEDAAETGASSLDRRGEKCGFPTEAQRHRGNPKK